VVAEYSSKSASQTVQSEPRQTLLLITFSLNSVGYESLNKPVYWWWRGDTTENIIPVVLKRRQKAKVVERG
jgi:hypothetical protein